jgi:uncharacterized protein YciI
MLYVIWAQDATNTQNLRVETRPAHVERLNVLVDEGRLIIAGPMPAVDSTDPGEAGMTGSMIVAEFVSLEAAQAWADADPYSKAGVYEQVTVKPYLKVLP